MTTAQAWMDEASLRLADAEMLHERNRHARAVSACYDAVLAAGNGALKAEGVDQFAKGPPCASRQGVYSTRRFA